MLPGADHRVSGKRCDAKLARVPFRHIFVAMRLSQNELIDALIMCINQNFNWILNCSSPSGYGCTHRGGRKWNARKNGEP